MLTLLQAVLGFDNLLYISMESKRVAESGPPAGAPQLGIGIAIVLRIVLLFVLTQGDQATSRIRSCTLRDERRCTWR